MNKETKERLANRIYERTTVETFRQSSLIAEVVSDFLDEEPVEEGEKVNTEGHWDNGIGIAVGGALRNLNTPTKMNVPHKINSWLQEDDKIVSKIHELIDYLEATKEK